MISSKSFSSILLFKIILLAVVIFNPVITKAQSVHDSVYVWYGNYNDLPISGRIDEIINVDVYVKTTADAYVANMCVPLGFNKTYIDTIFKDSCQIYWPLTEWDEAGFYTFNDEFQEGWNSLTFLGFADLGGELNPWLHTSGFLRILTFAAHSVSDSLLMGTTVEAFGPGLDRFQGPTNFGDTSGDAGYSYLEVFSELSFLDAVGAITGAVTDTSGAAVENVVVEILELQLTDTTNIQGVYFIDNIDEGTYDLSFSHTDYFDTIISNVAAAIDETTEVDVVLNSNAYGSITGIVADTNGLPIEGVLVEIENTSISDATDEQGVYLITDILTGKHVISFSHSGYLDTTISEVEIIQNDTIALNLIMSVDLPDEIILKQNYPNPFNGGTIIEFSLPKSAHVIIEIFDILGRKVETVGSFQGQAGTNFIKWNAGDISSGVYFYRVKSGSTAKSKSLLYIK